MFNGRLEGTLKTMFSIGKALKVSLRNNAGILEAQNSGGAWFPLIFGTVEAKNANFTAEYNKIYLLTGALNVQLPAPILNGRFVVKLLGNDDVTMVRAGSENIETLAANYILTSTREAATFVSNGVDWFRI